VLDGAHLTTSFPIVVAWNVQVKGQVPGLAGAVKEAVPPAFAATSKAPWVVEVTVWFSPSAFLTVTLEPGATDAGTVYLKSLIVIRPAAIVARGLALGAMLGEVGGTAMRKRVNPLLDWLSCM